MNEKQIIDRYEKMRAAALNASDSIHGGQSFGYVVLTGKGVLSWAVACGELHDCTLPRPRAKSIRKQTDSVVNLNDALKNILTFMALRAVEGAGNAAVNGI